MNKSFRTVRIVDEPIGGQVAGADGEYLVAEISYRLGKGYVLHVYYLEREKGDGYTTEKFALFTSGKSVLVQASNRFNQKRLDEYGLGIAGQPLVAGEVARLRGEVLALREENEARTKRQAQAFRG